MHTAIIVLLFLWLFLELLWDGQMATVLKANLWVILQAGYHFQLSSQYCHSTEKTLRALNIKDGCRERESGAAASVDENNHGVIRSVHTKQLYCIW